jgi:hypothetical protein
MQIRLFRFAPYVLPKASKGWLASMRYISAGADPQCTSTSWVKCTLEPCESVSYSTPDLGMSGNRRRQADGI